MQGMRGRVFHGTDYNSAGLGRQIVRSSNPSSIASWLATLSEPPILSEPVCISMKRDPHTYSKGLMRISCKNVQPGSCLNRFIEMAMLVEAGEKVAETPTP